MINKSNYFSLIRIQKSFHSPSCGMNFGERRREKETICIAHFNIHRFMEFCTVQVQWCSKPRKASKKSRLFHKFGATAQKIARKAHVLFHASRKKRALSHKLRALRLKKPGKAPGFGGHSPNFTAL